jgi:hypothetical protein
MQRWQTILTAIIPLTAFLAIGCLEHNEKLHYLGDAELQHYKHEATTIDYADVHEPVPDTVRGDPNTTWLVSPRWITTRR